ncbi:hypothetical protein ZWY2020_005123 [Hordeum vulgare]|nr:hypothetical protein ZWY2020_005123 [Hordeum vulgare]
MGRAGSPASSSRSSAAPKLLGPPPMPVPPFRAATARHLQPQAMQRNGIERGDRREMREEKEGHHLDAVHELFLAPPASHHPAAEDEVEADRIPDPEMATSEAAACASRAWGADSSWASSLPAVSPTPPSRRSLDSPASSPLLFFFFLFLFEAMRGGRRGMDLEANPI